jgi:hypothetical protein
MNTCVDRIRQCERDISQLQDNLSQLKEEKKKVEIPQPKNGDVVKTFAGKTRLIRIEKGRKSCSSEETGVDDVTMAPTMRNLWAFD